MVTDVPTAPEFGDRLLRTGAAFAWSGRNNDDPTIRRLIVRSQSFRVITDSAIAKKPSDVFFPRRKMGKRHSVSQPSERAAKVAPEGMGPAKEMVLVTKTEQGV